MDDAESYVRTDDESVLATDDAESYVRTDEEQSLSFRTDEEAELYDGNPKVSSLKKKKSLPSELYPLNCT